MINVNDTVQTYSGKRGCMCGCLGKYNESERARKMAITQMTRDSRVKLQTWNGSSTDQGCLYIDTNTRIRALYLNERGVKAAQAMGIEEE